MQELWNYISENYFPLPSRPGLFNPYNDSDPQLEIGPGKYVRRNNLRAYLDSINDSPEILFVTESMRAHAGRFSGIPMTSESQLLEGVLPFAAERSSRSTQPHSDTTSSLFWDALTPYFSRCLICSSIPFFSYGIDGVLSPRTPDSYEIEDYFDLFVGMVELLKPSRIVAVGGRAAMALDIIRIAYTGIPYPSPGRQHRFIEGVKSVFTPSPACSIPIKHDEEPLTPDQSALDREELLSHFKEENWQTVYWHQIAERKGETFPADELSLHDAARCILRDIPGLYRHQLDAVQAYLHGCNVCLATSTASGKTLAFHLSAIEQLSRNPGATILAIYPLKALASEQEERWRHVLQLSGLEAEVGRIDGSVRNPRKRKAILESASVLLMTPDVIHAWLMPRLGLPVVSQFLRKLSLIIIDEAHTYTGVFGSNSAFLFRRLNHAVNRLGGSPRYFAASATVASPEEHLKKLTGRQFRVVDSTSESSPQHELTVLMVEPPPGENQLMTVSRLLEFISLRTAHRFIAFVDSRKKTEYLASIAARRGTIDTMSLITDLPGKGKIQPYRAGYEEKDRKRIQRQLSTGMLKGVISTSALEMGIDIPWLSLGILLGVPDSATSFLQRVGRIGRHGPGLVIVINNHSVHSNTVFRRPDRLMHMPLRESALYLENEQIQYIHTLCFGRHGGEADAVDELLGDMTRRLSVQSNANFPASFLDLCTRERCDRPPVHLAKLREEGGENPNYTFPLRDIDAQLKVILREANKERSLGHISHAQAMREAYPGAVYYYAGKAYRVLRVSLKRRRVVVRREKKYITSPLLMPGLLTVSESPRNRDQKLTVRGLQCMEAELHIKEMVSGYRETRGAVSLTEHYPIKNTNGINYDKEVFSRNLKTTGILFFHPLLNRETVRTQVISDILLEAFLSEIGFERQDLGHGADRLREVLFGHQTGARFIGIYDQTFGGLHLTRCLLQKDILRKILIQAQEISLQDDRFNLNADSSETMTALRNCLE